MKRKLAKSWKRIVATTLIMAMILTSTSLESLAAETDGNSPPVKTEKEETTEKEVVVCKENVIESKNTEDSTTYDAGAGVLVTEYYGQDVRFRNEDGELVDYDPTLKKLESRDDLNGYEYDTSGLSFSALYMWRDINEFCFEIIGDYMCISGISHL